MSEVLKLESMLDAIVMQYEQATPAERAAMSPFCKLFYEMKKPSQTKSATANHKLVESNGDVKGIEALNSHSSIID